MNTNKIRPMIWSCLIVIAVNCNGFNAIQNHPDDCQYEDSKLGNTGYHASGSAYSSQFLLPGGTVVTHSKGSSYSSDGIKSTFEQLKKNADQFVSKQTDSLNIPNVLPPLHSGLDQDLHEIHNSDYIGTKNILNKLQSASQHKQTAQGSSIYNDQFAYNPIVSPGSNVLVNKHERVEVNKKVFTHGSPAFTGNEEFEVNQNGLDANFNTETVYPSVPSSVNKVYQHGNNKDVEIIQEHKIPIIPIPSTNKVKYQYINNKEVETTHEHKIPIVSSSSINKVYHENSNSKEVETVESSHANIPTKYVQIPIVPTSSQQSYSKYESSVKQNSSSHVVPGSHIYTPSFSSSGTQNYGDQSLHQAVGYKIPIKIKLAPESHYKEHKETVNVASSEINTEQKEQKYHAIPVNNKVDLPIKIKYTYDGRTLTKFEEYSSGVIKQVPIAAEETESVLKEIHQRQSTQQSYGTPVDQVQIQEGYHYPKAQSLSSGAQTISKQESHSSQSSHSQTITGDSQVEQLTHLPLQTDGQKQYYVYPAYTGIIPPASSSQIKSDQQTQTSQTYGSNFAPILLRGVPQPVVFPDTLSASSSGSSSSGSTFHSSSHFGGISKDVAYPDFLASSQAASNSAFERLSSSSHDSSGVLCSDCTSGLGLATGSIPLTKSYGVSTSFSSSSTNINGKKSENRQASVTVNDNGKVDTYNVKT